MSIFASYSLQIQLNFPKCLSLKVRRYINYKATCQANIKIDFNNLPCLKYHDLIGGKDTDEELKYKKWEEGFRRDKCNKIKLTNWKPIAEKKNPSIEIWLDIEYWSFGDGVSPTICDPAYKNRLDKILETYVLLNNPVLWDGWTRLPNMTFPSVPSMNSREFLYHSVDEQPRNRPERPSPAISARAN